MGKNVYTYEFKVNTIKNYLESGLTQKAFIDANGIAPCTFYNWLTRYRKASQETKMNLIDITNPIKTISDELYAGKTAKVFKLKIKNAIFEFDISQLQLVIGAINND